VDQFKESAWLKITHTKQRKKKLVSFRQIGLLNGFTALEWKRRETSFHGKDVTKQYGPSTVELSSQAVARQEVNLILAKPRKYACVS